MTDQKVNYEAFFNNFKTAMQEICDDSFGKGVVTVGFSPASEQRTDDRIKWFTVKGNGKEVKFRADAFSSGLAFDLYALMKDGEHIDRLGLRSFDKNLNTIGVAEIKDAIKRRHATSMGGKRAGQFLPEVADVVKQRLNLG